MFFFSLLDRTCKSKWFKAYEHDENGKSPGDALRCDLMASAIMGARIRLMIGENYITEADSLLDKGNDLHAQLLHHVSKASWNTFEEDAYWSWSTMNTAGHRFVTYYNVGSSLSRGNSSTKVAVKWFANPDKLQDAFYSNDQKGNNVDGFGVEDLKDAIKRGHDFRCVSNKEDFFSFQNLQFKDDVVAGQNVRCLGAIIRGTKLVFKDTPYWRYKILTSNGTRDTSKWTVGTHRSRGHKTDTASCEWFRDPCWKLIFSHDGTGKSLSGLREELMSAILSGSRVRIQLPSGDYFTTEADNLSIRNGHVTAQTLKYISKSSVEKFQDNAYWVWLMVSTTGTVKATRYNVGSHKHRGDSTEHQQVRWYIDTRSWTLALSHDQDGNVMSGSKDQLLEAVRTGAEVRCVHNDGKYAFSTQNLEIHGKDIAAQSLNQVSMRPVKGNPNEIEIEPNAYWQFTIVDTTGRRDISRWNVGEHVPRGHTNDRLGMQWFVS